MLSWQSAQEIVFTVERSLTLENGNWQTLGTVVGGVAPGACRKIGGRVWGLALRPAASLSQNNNNASLARICIRMGVVIY